MNLENIYFEKERERHVDNRIFADLFGINIFYHVFNGWQSIHKRKSKILFRCDSVYFCFDSWGIYFVRIRKYLINRPERRTYGNKLLFSQKQTVH